MTVHSDNKTAQQLCMRTEVRGRCVCLHTPVDCEEIKFPASEMTSLNNDEQITVQSRMMFATNPSFKLTSSRCSAASAMTKMNASSWKKGRIAILHEVQVGYRILRGHQFVDQAVA